jgi:type II secretory pathway pseudopilin PulG
MGSRRSARGFTYLWLLFTLAMGGVMLASIGQRSSVAVQREREAELLFRGEAIARAIGAYRAAGSGAQKRLPGALVELTEDSRTGTIVRHLRRVYDDPFTGKPDWVLLQNDEKGIRGVRSRADAPALRTIDLPMPTAGTRPLVSDRIFLAPAPRASAPAAAEDGASAPPGKTAANETMSIRPMRLE